jgi:hypothetical protein
LSALEFDTLEAKDELDGVPISHPDILKAIRNLIEETLDMIEATK